MANVRKQKRASEAIWAAEAMREETRRALRGRPEIEDEGDQEEEAAEEDRPFFPDYKKDRVIDAFNAVKASVKKVPLHNPKKTYSAKDIGKIIRVAEQVGLEGRLGYIAGVVEKIEGSDSGRLYVLIKKGEKLEKERCWFYAKQ